MSKPLYMTIVALAWLASIWSLMFLSATYTGTVWDALEPWKKANVGLGFLISGAGACVLPPCLILAEFTMQELGLKKPSR